MRYLGNKRRVRDSILPYLTRDLGARAFYEPFCGSCEIIASVPSLRRFASDNNPYLIALLEAVRDGWVPPSTLTRKDYYDTRKHKHEYEDSWVGYVGCGSFGGKWFAGHLKDQALQAAYARSLIKLAPLLRGVDLQYAEYWELEPRPNSIIYCDPPYGSTCQGYYSTEFDSLAFWQWVRAMSRDHTVYVSEYNAPDDFTSVWSGNVPVGLHARSKTRLERLWRWRP